MARFLLVVPPLTGHINPLLSVADELNRQGHQVAWAGNLAFLDRHVNVAGCCFDLPDIDGDSLTEKTQSVRGLESVTFFYDKVCFPLARKSFAVLEEIVRSFKPDMLICDHQMLAGALVARKANLPWVSSITTTASMLKPHEVLNEWLLRKYVGIQQDLGVDVSCARPDFSPYGCIVFSSRELLGDEFECVEAPYQFVGPAINSVRKPIEFPWNELDESKRKILISLGTVSRDRSLRFYQVMMEALAAKDLQVIMVAPEEVAVMAPDNFIIRDRVPLLELLPQVDLVVSHAGHNTVCETLSHGKPMVLAPIRDDQPIIARQVVNAGAGVSVRFGKVTAAAARQAIDSVLADDRYLFSARRIQQSFQALSGAKQAVCVMEDILKENSGAENYASASP